MAEDERAPADYAAEIEAARDRLIAFTDGCSEAVWHADNHRTDIETALAAQGIRHG